MQPSNAQVSQKSQPRSLISIHNFRIHEVGEYMYCVTEDAWRPDSLVA